MRFGNDKAYSYKTVPKSDEAYVINMFIKTAMQYPEPMSHDEIVILYDESKRQGRDYLEYGLYHNDKLVGCNISYAVAEDGRFVSCLYIDKQHRLQLKASVEVWHALVKKQYGIKTVKCVANNPRTLQVEKKLGYNVLYTVLGRGI